MNQIIIVFYILMNLFFLNTVYNNYPNIVLFIITIGLLISEVLFWGLQLYNISLINKKNIYIQNTENDQINDNSTKEFLDIDEWIIRISFLSSIFLIGIVRVFMYSSVYINDLVLFNSFFRIIVGTVYIINIFMSVVFVYYVIDKKNKIMLVISLFNVLIAILIWIELDSNITTILRIVISLLTLLFIYKNTRLWRYK